MPQIVKTSSCTTSISLADFVDSLEELKIDTDNPEDFLRSADLLQQLSNNKSFLGDFLIDCLKNSFTNQLDLSKYTAQSVMLSELSIEKNYYLRANFWPPVTHNITKASGQSALIYDYAHDHDFNFMTVGYSGSGYESDNYEYDHGSVEGYVGEKVNLIDTGRSTLRVGDVHCYRANLDIHNQIPPETLSTSINIMGYKPGLSYKHQYAFDLKKSEISEVMTHDRDSFLSIFTIMLNLGIDESKQLILDIAAQHPSQNMQLAAIVALMSDATEDKDLEQVHNIGADSDYIYVQEMSKSYFNEIEPDFGIRKR